MHRYPHIVIDGPKRRERDSDPEEDKAVAYNRGLLELRKDLETHGVTLSQYGLPEPTEDEQWPEGTIVKITVGGSKFRNPSAHFLKFHEKCVKIMQNTPVL